MELNSLLRAFTSVLLGEERVKDSYLAASRTLQLKQCLLAGPLPFSLRDELDLNRDVLAYVDTCISQISTMQKLAGLPRLSFPILHALLRMFRDYNHHVGYHPFVPYRCPNDPTEFYVWPVLRILPGVRDKYGSWWGTPNRLTLGEMLTENQGYLLELIAKTKTTPAFVSLDLKFHKVYQIGELSFGPAIEGSRNDG
ncbi:MAG: hypothetical protein L6Q75_01325 [Burkholderiaceae bacterium]|nr:hypothetical protein [Burkholderiaceae bacterium]